MCIYAQLAIETICIESMEPIQCNVMYYMVQIEFETNLSGIMGLEEREKKVL